MWQSLHPKKFPLSGNPLPSGSLKIQFSISYQPPPQNRVLAMTERNSSIVVSLRAPNTCSFLVTLSAGNYTATVRGVGGTTGTGRCGQQQQIGEQPKGKL